MTNFVTPPSPPSAKINNRCIVYKQHNLQIRDNSRAPIPLPCEHHKYRVPK